MKQFSTLKEIAKKLGVSVSTVSRALSDSYEISESQKERIRAYVKEINYQPNPHAKSLRSNQSKTIGVLIPDISNYFFTLALQGIETIVHEKGYNLMIYQTHDDHLIEEKTFSYLENGVVDGVLSAVSSNKEGSIEHVKRLNSLIPIVFFDRHLKQMTVPFVSCNDYESGLHATKHLLERGCRNIVFIGIDESISVTADRLDGYRAALHQMDISVKESNILLCTSQEEAYEQILKRLKQRDKADAFFSSVERYTVQLYRACEELKLKIPADLKVISFSNNPLASFMNPPLSTITQPAFEIGKSAAGLLLEMLKKKKPAAPKDLVIPCTFHYTVSSLGNK